MKKVIIIISILVCATQLSAQQAMTLEECRKQAVEHNKELKNAEYQKQEAKANQKTARTAYLPSVSASANAMYLPNVDGFSIPGGFLPTAASEEAALNGEFSGVSDVWSPGMGIEMDNLSVVYGSVTVAQPLYVGGKIRYANKQADAGLEIFDHNYSLKYSEIIEKTDNIYWNIASISANVGLAKKYIEMLTELEEQMVQMYDLGLTPVSEKLKVSVQKNEADLNLVKAKNGLKISKMYMNQILGQDLNTEIQIVDSLTYDIKMFDVQNGVSNALSNRDELAILEKQLEITKYDKKIILADYLPQVGISAGYSSYYVKDLVEDPSFSPSIAGQISIPIFQWGQGKHKQDAAELRIKQAQTTLENTNELISLEVQQVKIQIEEAYESIQIAKKNIAEAQESLDETKASFEVGLNTTTDVLNAQAGWQSANSQLINALAQFEILQTTWQKVTGNLKLQIVE
jgi:outer membrane protein TolC